MAVSALGQAFGKRQVCATDHSAMPSMAPNASAYRAAATPPPSAATPAATPWRWPRATQARPQRATPRSSSSHSAIEAATTPSSRVAAAAAWK